MTADASDSSDSACLPPPQPPDKEGTRPRTDWKQVVRQVRGIQQFVAQVAAGKKQEKGKGDSK